ncbi:MAG: type II toxin-antitoxin system VapC family toxin [Anaerolineae bacterium]|nr:type II toxin-antitoxin system VapC family toxin [Anaerolineae bacterium]MDW8068116.1 type II toxin-antitoxin system VapC family toxin [Anaerolineae bacterium]
MNVVDSSGWLEYLANGPNADFFAPAIRDTDHLLIPTICLYEVFKHLSLRRGEEAALEAVGVLYSGRVVDVTADVALYAAQLSIQHRLPMADSLILATARLNSAVLWTQDEHFQGLEGVRYIAK